MKLSFMIKWYKAIASGKFIQSEYYLVDGKDRKKTHCCLGVACIVEAGAVRQSYRHHGGDTLSDSFRKRIGMTPVEEREFIWANSEDFDALRDEFKRDYAGPIELLAKKIEKAGGKVPNVRRKTSEVRKDE